MGFVLPHHIAGVLLEAGVRAMLGPDVEIDDEAYLRHKTDTRLDQIEQVVTKMHEYLVTASPLIESLREKKEPETSGY